MEGRGFQVVKTNGRHLYGVATLFARRTRFTLGVPRVKWRHELGLFYRYGLVTAEDRDRSRRSMERIDHFTAPMSQAARRSSACA